MKSTIDYAEVLGECPHNMWLDCPTKARDCEQCGWNPETHKRRVLALRKRMSVMRDIVFRGKRMDGKGWAYGDLVRTRGGEVYIADGNGEPPQLREVHPKSIGQYTGLLDSSGKQIFEGDYIGSSESVVRYRNGTFEAGDKLLYWMTNCSIVGNIHDDMEE